MVSQRKNKIIEITADEFGTLELIESGVLGEFRELMSKEQALQIAETGKLDGKLMPFAYSFAPSFESAQDVLESVKSGEILELSYNSKIIGELKVGQIYIMEKPSISIFTAKNICILDDKNELGRRGVSGSFKLYKNELSELKEQIFAHAKAINAKKITAIMLTADPMHRLHERLMRVAIDKADFIVVFLVRTFSGSGRLDFDLRLECLRYVCENFIPPERVKIVPFSNTTLFSDHINPILEAIAAKNFGANKLVIGQNHTGLGMIYDNNQASTLLDEYTKELGLELIVMPEMFYCNSCHTIVSSKSCPHGNHHHIKYHANTIKQLLFAGMMPPAILVRPQISALILDRLFGNRFSSRTYDDLFPNRGIIEKHTQRDFYEKLMQLYQTVSLN